jgi:transposase
MITPPPGVRVFVWPVPVDFRRGMDSLAALVQVTLRRDPFAGDIFVFRAARGLSIIQHTVSSRRRSSTPGTPCTGRSSG